MSAIVFRVATEDDVDAMRAAEAAPAARRFLRTEPRAHVVARLTDPDHRTLILSRDGADLGHALWAGLSRQDGVLELRRIVMATTDRGDGTAGLRALLDQAFGAWSAHRVWLDTVEDNHRAQHVYRKLGFVEEGRQRETFLMDGVRRDLLLYGMLRREWAAQ